MKMRSTCPATMSLSGRTRAAIRHMRHLDPGERHEQLSRQMRGCADALGCKVELPRIGLRIDHELLRGPGRKIVAYEEHVWKLGHDGDRLELARIKVELLVERHV